MVQYGKNEQLAGSPVVDENVAIYVGLDVHKKNWHATIRTFNEELKRTVLPGTTQNLIQLLAPYENNPRIVAYEAGPFGFWLHDELCKLGVQCVVAAPSLIPKASGNRVKTDRRDSANLADLLATRRLKTVVVPSEEEYANREVSRRRHRLVADRRRQQTRLKSFLARYGRSAQEPRYWNSAEVTRLEDLRWGNPWQQQSWDSLVREYKYLNEASKAQLKVLCQLAKTPRYKEQVKLLRTAPGIGLITAMEFLLELQDVGRFRRGEQLAAYVGLTPSQFTTGDKVRLGHITKTGKPGLRSCLVEGSWKAIAKDEELRAKYERIKDRSGSKKAIVAVAHNLLLRMRRMILDGKPYQKASPAP